MTSRRCVIFYVMELSRNKLSFNLLLCSCIPFVKEEWVCVHGEKNILWDWKRLVPSISAKLVLFHFIKAQSNEKKSAICQIGVEAIIEPAWLSMFIRFKAMFAMAFENQQVFMYCLFHVTLLKMHFSIFLTRYFVIYILKFWQLRLLVS